MIRWRVALQDQPARTLFAMGADDPWLFAKVTVALRRLDGEAGTAVDEWGDLRNVVLAGSVTAEVLANPDDEDGPVVEVLRLVWVPGLTG